MLMEKDWARSPEENWAGGRGRSASHSPPVPTGVGSCSFLQGIVPTQGPNPGLQHCRWILNQCSEPPGKPEGRKAYSNLKHM